MMRMLASLVVACAALASGCLVEFAIINLRVHESANEALRRAAGDNTMQVKYVLDEILADGSEGVRVVNGFSYGNDDDLKSAAQKLTANRQRMAMALAVGKDNGFPLASALSIGRVDPVLVPSLDDGTIAIEALAFLAEPDTIELLDNGVPAGGPQAVCDNGAGFVHAIGNDAAYSFSSETLLLNINDRSFSANGDPIIACDVEDVASVVVDGELKLKDGAVVVAHGTCVGDEEGTHTLVFNAGAENEEKLEDEPGELCDPFVRVVTVEGGSVVWIATKSFAALYTLDGTLLGRQPFAPFLSGTVRHVLLDSGTLIASADGVDAETGDTNGVIIRRISDAALQPAVASVGLDNMIAGDPSGQAALFDLGDPDDGEFVLRVVKVGDLDDDDNVVSVDGKDKDVVFEAGFIPTRILVLGGDDDDRSNDVVVGMNDVGDVQVEGGKLFTSQPHNRFAVGFGRAIILAGNQVGHRVLVRAFSDAERALLEQRIAN